MPRLPLYFLLLLAFASALTGCAGKTVDVVQANQFKTMAERMPAELQARNIIDNDMDYVSTLLPSSDTPYGDILFRRLSPDFLFEDQASRTSAASFAATIFPGDKAQTRAQGFSIRRPRQNVHVNMIAITDWDGDGRKDWLVSCAVENLRGGKTRDFYVIIPEPQGEGPLTGTVAAVYESFGVAGRLYVRDSARKTEVAPSDTPVVEEAMPGLKPVTTPPQKGKKSSGGLEERAL